MEEVYELVRQKAKNKFSKSCSENVDRVRNFPQSTFFRGMRFCGLVGMRVGSNLAAPVAGQSGSVEAGTKNSELAFEAGRIKKNSEPLRTFVLFHVSKKLWVCLMVLDLSQNTNSSE